MLDDEDYERAKHFKWYTHRVGGNLYAAGYPEGKCTHLHRWLCSVTDRKYDVDHANGDGLDNRRENLRVCTRAQNCVNTRSRNPNRLKGATLMAGNRSLPWRAQITLNKKNTFLGYYKTEQEAHEAYLSKMKELFGEFVCTR